MREAGKPRSVPASAEAYLPENIAESSLIKQQPRGEIFEKKPIDIKPLRKSGDFPEYDVLNPLEKGSEIPVGDETYNRLKKLTLLRTYNNYGIDISYLYDPSTLDIKKKEQQEDWLDTNDITTIADSIDSKIKEIRSRYLNSASVGGFQAGENIFELIAKLKDTPEVGIPLYGNFLNTIVRGARLKKLYLRSAPTGVGKAIPNTTIIPTPLGFKRVDEIKVGDHIFGKNGQPTIVVGVHPQLEKKEIYNIYCIWSYYVCKITTTL
jgi:hypothetical protein